MTKNNDDQKPVRLYFKSYLKVIKNSVGSRMFKNFYVSTPQRGEFDAFGDGDNSCAFFVSSLLTIFKKIDGIHGTVESTGEALKKAGWKKVASPKAGDVLIWQPIEFKNEGLVAHIGFFIGHDRAISTSWKKKCVVEHDLHFGKPNRQLAEVLRMKDWDDYDS